MSARTARVFGAALAALLLIAAAAPEGRLAQYQRLRREGAAAVQTGDHDKAVESFREALDLYPDVPGSYIRLARVQAAAGDLDAALTNVQLYAGMGLLFDVEKDPALKALSQLPGYADVAALFTQNAEPVGDIEAVATISGAPEMMGEGLANDGQGWLLGTVAGRTIVRLTPDGTTPFLKADADTGAIFGLAIDARRGVLWAAEARGDGVPGASGPARTGLLKVSVGDGTILARYPLPDDGARRQIGDLVLARDGTVYATDSIGGGVWRLKPGSAALDPVVEPGHMASPQGMVLCPGERAMLVADYATGLHRVDLASGEDRPLEGLMAGLAGTDGLVAAPGFDFGLRGEKPFAAVITQNGVSPQRVMLLQINPGCSEVERTMVLAANLPGMNDLSLAGVRGAEVVFVGHARWDTRADDGRLVTPAPGPVRVFRLTLPKGMF